MRKSILQFIPFLLLTAVTSCGDNRLITQVDSPKDPQMVSEPGESLCSCPGYTLVESGGEYSCPAGEGCSKIVPCPCPVALGVSGPDNPFHADKYADFQAAQASGTLPLFFDKGDWMSVFPDLKDNPALRNDLIAGVYTVHTVTDSKGGLFLLVAPPVPAKGGVVSAGDAKLAVEIPAGVL